MKLLRHGTQGAEKPGMLDGNGVIRDLSSVISEIDGGALAPESIKRLAGIDPASLPEVPKGTRLGAPIVRPLNFVCIGLNYVDHAEETNSPIPKEPIIFLKAATAYSGPFDDVVIPRGAVKTDWEVELGVVIGKKASYVPEHDAMNYVGGYCVVNDVSERDYQMNRGGTWDKGKGCPTFGPVGPYLVTADEVPDPQALDLWCEVDGKRMQNGNTRTMIFDVRKLVTYVSHFIELHPGDIIATGTPPGVGLGQKPEPIFLKPGQTMRLGISGLGEQQQRTVGRNG